MITVKHLLEEKQKVQQEFLNQVSEDTLRFHELSFSYGNATYIYHHRASDFKPNLTDWEEWLEGLPSNISNDMRQRGFDNCKTILSFTRYVNEKNDIGLDEFVCSLMGKEEYEEYKSFLNE